MLFQVLIIFNLLVGLNNADGWIREYNTDTKIYLELNNVGKIPVCTCNAGRCQLSESTSADLCTAYQKRFEYLGNANPSFMYCQIDFVTCQQTNKPNPDKVHMRIIFDQFSLVSSPLWMGTESFTPMMQSIFRNEEFPQDQLSQLQLHGVKTSIGKHGMPVEFTGVLHYKPDEILDFYYCTKKNCLVDANNFCTAFEKTMRDAKIPIMPYYLGCRVKRFYEADKQSRADWAMYFDYAALVRTGLMNTQQKMQDIWNRIQSPKLNNGWLLYYVAGRIFPMDFCEISAGAITTRRYYDEFKDPFSVRTRVAAGEHYRILMQQIAAGDDKCPSCFRFPTEIRFSKVGKYARVDMTLFVSGTCFNKQGVHSCEKIALEIERQWKNGSQTVPNDMAPKYEFKFRQGHIWME